jgi:hypothetical protein
MDFSSMSNHIHLLFDIVWHHPIDPEDHYQQTTFPLSIMGLPGGYFFPVISGLLYTIKIDPIPAWIFQPLFLDPNILLTIGLLDFNCWTRSVAHGPVDRYLLDECRDRLARSSG